MNPHLTRLLPPLFLFAACLCLAPAVFGSEEEPEAASEAAPDATLTSLWRLEEQQEALLRSLQQVQDSSAMELQKNAEALSAGLRQLETLLAEQRRTELQNQQSFNRMFLTCVAVLGGLAILGTGAMAFMMLKTTRRVSELGIAALTGGHPHLLGLHGPGGASRADASSEQFLSSIAALEERLKQMEAVPLPPAPARSGWTDRPSRSDG